jgi:hypothetical protein
LRHDSVPEPVFGRSWAPSSMALTMKNGDIRSPVKVYCTLKHG